MMAVPEGLTDALLTSASDAIIATDRDGIVTFWNPGAVRIFGFSFDEAIGQPLDFIIPDNLRARHWVGYEHTMTTGESRYGAGDLLSVPALTKSGQRISVEFTIAMLRDERGLPTGTVAILRDVTRNFAEKLALRREVAELRRTAPNV